MCRNRKDQQLDGRRRGCCWDEGYDVGSLLVMPNRQREASADCRRTVPFPACKYKPRALLNGFTSAPSGHLDSSRSLGMCSRGAMITKLGTRIVENSDRSLTAVSSCRGQHAHEKDFFGGNVGATRSPAARRGRVSSVAVFVRLLVQVKSAKIDVIKNVTGTEQTLVTRFGINSPTLDTPTTFDGFEAAKCPLSVQDCEASMSLTRRLIREAISNARSRLEPQNVTFRIKRLSSG